MIVQAPRKSPAAVEVLSAYISEIVSAMSNNLDLEKLIQE
jgi:hypothetical protein